MSRREPSRKKLLDVFMQHKPSGWTLEEVTPASNGMFYYGGDYVYGLTIWDTKTIRTLLITDRATLAYALHECGHVHMGHEYDTEYGAIQEYEAEQYAIKAIRAAGMSFPRPAMEEARAYVRSFLEGDPTGDYPEHVRRFARW